MKCFYNPINTKQVWPFYATKPTTDLSTFDAEDAHLTKANSLTKSNLVREEKLNISCFLSMSVFLGNL